MKRCPGERWRWFQLEWKGAKWDRLTVQLMVVVVLWKSETICGLGRSNRSRPVTGRLL
jgi:hypothetical protein